MDGGSFDDGTLRLPKAREIIKSAFISRASYVKHKTLLWERAPSVQPKLPNAVSGQSNLFDTTIAPETEPVKGQTYEEFIEQIEGKPMAAQGEGQPSPSAKVREPEKKKTLKRIIRETTKRLSGNTERNVTNGK